jgi:hypothetical protein
MSGRIATKTNRESAARWFRSIRVDDRVPVSASQAPIAGKQSLAERAHASGNGYVNGDTENLFTPRHDCQHDSLFKENEFRFLQYRSGYSGSPVGLERCLYYEAAFVPDGSCPAYDLSWYANIPVLTSHMVTGTEQDFFGGYDHRDEAGMVHVASHHISPGKKQWTWGNHEFGHAWDRNLTDNDGPYIELMAGVYTDK